MNVEITDEEVDYVIKVVRSFYERVSTTSAKNLNPDAGSP
jgi:hypothetical protein